MNIIIVEGLDNTGKSTVINSLKDHFEKLGKKVQLIHCKAPEGDTLEEKADYQNRLFTGLAQDAIRAKRDKACDVMIFDRAWYGEYVYGQIYRRRDPFSIVMNINSIEESLKYYFDEKELAFILLDVDKLDFCVKHDDGLSIADCELSRIANEQHNFQEIFGMSTLPNKQHVIVNDGDEFKSKEEIFEQVMSAVIY